MRGFKMMFGLGVALLLGVAGLGQARVEVPGGFLPLDWPEGVGSATRTMPDPSHERSAQRTLHESPERLTFTSGGHVLRFAPDHLLTAGATHALKVEFVGANPTVPQSDAPAGDNPVGSAMRTIPDPSSEWSAQRTRQDSPRPLGEGLGVRAEGTQGFRSFPRSSLGTAVAKSRLPGDLDQPELAEQGSQAGAWEPVKPAENRVGSATRTIPDPSSEWSAQRTLQDSPRPLGEGLGVRAEGTQGFRSFPRSSLGTGVAKSQLPGDLDQQELAEQGSQAGAWEPAKPAENRVGSALRTIPDPSHERSAQRTLHNANQKAPPLTEVRYPNLWQGIDLSYRAAPGGIAESVYQIRPGADIDQVRLRYNRPLSLDAEGRLNIRFDSGLLTESAPVAWQEREGERQAVTVAFVQHGEQELGFRLGDYDPSRALWIDPTLEWNTFLGGSDGDYGYGGIALDSNGNLYVTGYSYASWGNPVRAFTPAASTGAYGVDAFVAKLNPNGVLLWNTFLGGGDWDAGYHLAVDGSGYVYVTGQSWATWSNPIRPYAGGSGDIVVAKLNGSTGQLLWNTFLGSDFQDYSGGIAVDGVGNLCVTGASQSSWGTPLQPYAGGGNNIVVVKLSGVTGQVLWNTFLGGGGYSSDLAVESSGNLYVTGYSWATWGSPLRAFSDGWGDAFVAKLDANGTLLWNTFLGGSSDDWGSGLAVDSSGNVYVTGWSRATWGSPVRAFLPGSCGYIGSIGTGGGMEPEPCADISVAKLSGATGQLLWHTFLGSADEDRGNGIAVDTSGNVYITGESYATWDSPVWAFSPGSGCGSGPCPDVVVAKLSGVTGQVLWNTFLGSAYRDAGSGITLDDKGSIYVTGLAGYTWGNPVNPWANWFDAFIAKLSDQPTGPQDLGPALDNTSLTWSSGGDAPWSAQTEQTYLGGDAAESGAVADGESSYLRTNADGPGWVRFQWQVSSEAGFDFLRFYLDGLALAAISGEVGWRQETYVLGPGPHSLIWAYEKDGAGSAGADAAWVDAVSFGQAPGYVLSLSLNNNGWIQSWPAGIDCRRQGGTLEGVCEASFAAGTQISLSPVNDGHVLSGWGGACGGSEPVCTLALVDNSAVSVTFAPSAQLPTTLPAIGDTGIHPSLTVSSLGKGWVDAALSGGGATGIAQCRSESGQGSNCYKQWPGAVSVVVSATPDPGNRFVRWQGDACEGVSERQCTLVVDKHKDIQARFEGEEASSYLLQVKKTGNGSVSGGSINCGNQCTATYTKGNGVSLNASPASGYSFNGWSGDCSGTSCQLTMNGPKEVTANFVPTAGPSYALNLSKPNFGTVRTPGGDLYCGSGGNACAKNYPGGTELVLEAIADSGYYFDTWGGACSGKSDCRLSLDSAKSVTASFIAIPPINYQLILSLEAGGSVSVAGKGSCSGGQSCDYPYTSTSPPTQASLTATPNSGYRFNGWSGDCVGQGNPCSFAMSQNRTATASFAVNSGGTAPPRLQVYTSGQGAVSGPGISCGADCSETYSLNQSVQLTASAQGGSRFGGWGGACSGTNATCNLQMGYDKSVTAQFIDDSANTRTLSVNVSGLGTVSTDENPPKIDCRTSGCQASYETWQNAKLYAEPDPGKSFLGWGGACSGWGTGNTCVLSMSAHQQVSASFTQGSAANHTLTVNKNGSGTVSGPGINCGADCSESYSSGTAVTLNATPATGWQFSGWSGDCSGQGACTLNMTAAKNATANFSYQGGGANPNPNPNPSLRVGTDTDGDGKADILWRNIATGENWRYRMNGSSIQGSNPINTVSNLDWKIAGIGDFNGDGKADILWRNSSTGENWLYLMNGNGIQGSNPINTVSNLDWKIAGVGDLDGDGKADILWRNSVTGENWLYRMNGNSIQGSNPVNTVSNLDWKIVGVSDFDGDGKADILWRNSSTGENWLYLMNGNSIQGSNPINTVSNLDWKIAGIGDFDGDGKADILWRNSSTGENWLYRMNGNSIQGSNPINSVSNLDWKIVLVSDFDGDGKADILWRNSVTGENWLYRMNGNSIQGSNPINTVSNLNWQIQGGGGN